MRMRIASIWRDTSLEYVRQYKHLFKPLDCLADGVSKKANLGQGATYKIETQMNVIYYSYLYLSTAATSVP